MTLRGAKPIHAGFSISEDSKVKVHIFHNSYILEKYVKDARLLK